MYQFTVSDMTCGHCASTITRAVKQADPQAKVEVLLADKRVRVESALSQAEVAREIAEAGYTPQAA
jgi:copper chaperone